MARWFSATATYFVFTSPSGVGGTGSRRCRTAWRGLQAEATDRAADRGASFDMSNLRNFCAGVPKADPSYVRGRSRQGQTPTVAHRFD